MTAITFPSTLPTPTAVSLELAERRLAAGMGGNAPGSARAVQRDYGATASLSWTLDAAQYAIFHAWWKLALDFGSAWFDAPLWPMPWGRGAVVRLMADPSVRHLGRGLRQIDAQAEIRGASETPAESVHAYPMTITEVTAEDITEFGGDLVLQRGAIVSLSDDWQVPMLDYAGPGDALLTTGRILPTRGVLLSGPVQMRGTADTSAALGRLGIVVGVASAISAGLLLADNQATRLSRITGASDRGAVSVFVWDEPITAVHVGVLGLASYTVQNSGLVSAASLEMLRFTFSADDAVRVLYVHESGPTNYAGDAGTGSARMVSVFGMQLPS